MKIISKVPLKAQTEKEVAKIMNAIKYANYGWFFTVFVYTNIALYFLFMVKIIFSL